MCHCLPRLATLITSKPQIVKKCLENVIYTVVVTSESHFGGIFYFIFKLFAYLDFKKSPNLFGIYVLRNAKEICLNCCMLEHYMSLLLGFFNTQSLLTYICHDSTWLLVVLGVNWSSNHVFHCGDDDCHWGTQLGDGGTGGWAEGQQNEKQSADNRGLPTIR